MWKEGRRERPQVPLSENLFSAVSYALFAAPAAIVVIWLVWHLTVWCLSHARRQGAAPRLFARNTSRTVSAFFLFFLALPLVLVPLKFLAYRLAGPQITGWHWLIAYGPVPVMALWLAARLRRKRTDYF
jgi:hypothetical protein